MKGLAIGALVIAAALGVVGYLAVNSPSTEGTVTASGGVGNWKMGAKHCITGRGERKVLRVDDVTSGTVPGGAGKVVYEDGADRVLIVEHPRPSDGSATPGSLPSSTLFKPQQCPKLQATIDWDDPDDEGVREADGVLDFNCNNGTSSVTGHITFTGCGSS